MSKNRASPVDSSEQNALGGVGECEVAAAAYFRDACTAYEQGGATRAIELLGQAERQCSHAYELAVHATQPQKAIAIDQFWYRLTTTKNTIAAEPELQRRELAELLDWVDGHLRCSTAIDKRHRFETEQHCGVTTVSCVLCHTRL